MYPTVPSTSPVTVSGSLSDPLDALLGSIVTAGTETTDGVGVGALRGPCEPSAPGADGGAPGAEPGDAGDAGEYGVAGAVSEIAGRTRDPSRGPGGRSPSARAMPKSVTRTRP